MSFALTSKRLRRITLAVAIGLTLAALAEWIAPRSMDSILSRGDFPGLYVQAEMIARGLGDRLYDPSLQREVENELWPQLEGRFLMSVYPPSVGVLLLPLTMFPLWCAQILYTACNLVAFLVAVAVVRNCWRLRYSIEASVALLCFAPCFYGVLGGQNSGFSALFAALMLYGLCHVERRKGQLIAGIAVGLWCYKPQLGGYALAVLLAAGALPASLWAMVVLAGHYFVGALVVSARWPVQVVEALQLFSPQNFKINLVQQSSIIGASYWTDSYLVHVLAIGTTLGTVAFVLRRLFRDRTVPFAVGRLSVALACITLLVPQALFYDLSVAALPLVGLVRVNAWSQLALLSVAIGCSWFLTWNRAMLPFPAMLLIAMAIPIVVLYLIRRKSVDNLAEASL